MYSLSVAMNGVLLNNDKIAFASITGAFPNEVGDMFYTKCILDIHSMNRLCKTGPIIL